MQGTVLLVGATSQIGIFAIPRLLASGFRVLAVSRKPQPLWFPDMDGTQWLRADDWRTTDCSGVRMLLSAGPIALAEEWQTRLPALRRMVVFSTTSVISQFDSRDRVERDRVREIAATEKRLARVCRSAEVSVCLLRPALVYGCGLDGNVSRLARWIRRFGFIPLARDATGLRQPVHADDLAKACVSALLKEDGFSIDSPLAGGCTLSYLEMVEAIFTSQGRRVRILRLPVALLSAFARFARILPGMGDIGPEMIKRQSMNLVYDDTLARQLLGFAPRPFQPLPVDFHLPTRNRLQRLAGAVQDS